MTIRTIRFVRKPLIVDAVQVTDENIYEVAKWCSGFVDIAKRYNRPEAQYVKVDVLRPGNIRQTRAFVGDWVLRAGTSYKVYTQKAFASSFEVSPHPPNE